jgi:hypothetical protein
MRFSTMSFCKMYFTECRNLAFYAEWHYTEWHYTHCHYSYCHMLTVIIMNVIYLCVVIRFVVVLNIIFLNVIMLNVIVVNVVAPSKYSIKVFYYECWQGQYYKTFRCLIRSGNNKLECFAFRKHLHPNLVIKEVGAYWYL